MRRTDEALSRGDVLARRFLPTDHYRVTASIPGSTEYVDNVHTGTFTIEKAQSSGGIVECSGSGGTLSGYTLKLKSDFMGVDGQPITGTLSWDQPGSTKVYVGQAYGWTFHSSNPNYRDATGKLEVVTSEAAAKVDKTKLAAILAEAEALRGDTIVSSNGANVATDKWWVTQDVENTLLSAIAHGNRHLNSPATQEEVDHGIEGLRVAMASYRNSRQQGRLASGGGGGAGGAGGGSGSVLPPAPAKQESTVVLGASTVTVKPGDDPKKITVGGQGDGALMAIGDNDAIAFVDVRGTSLYVTGKREGTCQIRVTRMATDTFAEASTTLTVHVGEAPEDFDPEEAQPEPEMDAQKTFRLYNRYSGEHLITKSQTERDNLVRLGWDAEQEHKSPLKSNTPVYRLYNPYTKDHHYTTSLEEYQGLEKIGWQGEDIQFYSDDDKAIPVYRLFNPYVEVNTHHYTDSEKERDDLVKLGWKAEDVCWHYMD